MRAGPSSLGSQGGSEDAAGHVAADRAAGGPEAAAAGGAERHRQPARPLLPALHAQLLAHAPGHPEAGANLRLLKPLVKPSKLRRRD